MAPIRFAFGLHFHQPVGNFDHVFAQHVDDVYRPLLDALAEREFLPVVLHLSGPLLETVVRRLHHMLRPGAYLLALFHSEERAETIPTYSYRIQDRKTITLAPRGRRRPAQFFNNRSLEKLFSDFESVKFFLTRDHLREVIVRR